MVLREAFLHNAPQDRGEEGIFDVHISGPFHAVHDDKILEQATFDKADVLGHLAFFYDKIVLFELNGNNPALSLRTMQTKTAVTR